jgi:potassium-transporting ATPase KdpC subunit
MKGKVLMQATKAVLILTLICGVAYPIAITAISQIAFPKRANGSLIIAEGNTVGSELIGQNFEKPENFWGRPSAIGYNPTPSGASNMNPVGEKLKTAVKERYEKLRQYHASLSLGSVPKDILFSSASGVDPDISPEAAYFQIERIAQYRRLTSEQIANLRKVIKNSIQSPYLWSLGEPRVNVLKLNIYLKNL